MLIVYKLDSESESEEEASNVYYSCRQSNQNIADPMIKRTEFCLNLNVEQGLFTMVTQSRVIIKYICIVTLIFFQETIVSYYIVLVNFLFTLKCLSVVWYLIKCNIEC